MPVSSGLSCRDQMEFGVKWSAGWVAGGRAGVFQRASFYPLAVGRPSPAEGTAGSKSLLEKTEKNEVA